MSVCVHVFVCMRYHRYECVVADETRLHSHIAETEREAFKLFQPCTLLNVHLSRSLIAVVGCTSTRHTELNNKNTHNMSADLTQNSPIPQTQHVRLERPTVSKGYDASGARLSTTLLGKLVGAKVTSEWVRPFHMEVGQAPTFAGEGVPFLGPFLVLET